MTCVMLHRRPQRHYPPHQSLGEPAGRAAPGGTDSADPDRRKKRQVNVMVANHVTMHLNTYFKVGRIATKSDFKDLSRKMSAHFIQRKGGCMAFDVSDKTDTLKEEVKAHIDAWFLNHQVYSNSSSESMTHTSGPGVQAEAPGGNGRVGGGGQSLGGGGGGGYGVRGGGGARVDGFHSSFPRTVPLATAALRAGSFPAVRCTHPPQLIQHTQHTQHIRHIRHIRLRIPSKVPLRSRPGRRQPLSLVPSVTRF